MIYFLGDVHGSFGHIIPAIEPVAGSGCVSLVFLGDVQSPRPFEEEIEPFVARGWGVHYITGNHDSDTFADWANLNSASARSLEGQVLEIEGVRIAGLGGVFRREIWQPGEAPKAQSYEQYLQWLTSITPRRERADLGHGGKGLRHKTSIFPQVYERLAKLRADVLVTHEAPSAHPMGFGAIDELARDLKVGKLFHGHQHDNLDYSAHIQSMGFTPYGVGLRGITDLEGHIIRAGEIDLERAGEREVRAPFGL